MNGQGKKIRVNKKAVLAVAIIATATVVLGLIWGILSQKEPSSSDPDPYQGEDLAKTFYQGKWYEERNDLEKVLLIGLDKFSADIGPDWGQDRNDQQADFLLLLLIDHTNHTYSALHINRDTMAEIPVLGLGSVYAGHTFGQLTLSHTYGTGGKDSCRNTVEAVSDFLYGVKIDHYMSFTMDAVSTLTDCVGGVELTALNDFPDHPGWTQGSQITLRGEDALLYVRARGGLEDSSNLQRMERQQQYLMALQEKLRLKANEESFLISILQKLSEDLVSDYTVEQLQKLADTAAQYTADTLHTVKGEAVKGQKFMEFYADEEALKQQVVSLLFRETVVEG